jgi:hypothetical protein
MLKDSLLDHVFQEYSGLEGHHVKGQNSVMAFKRSSLDGINTLWKELMLRAMTGVTRLGANSPTEEITMSTTGSKLEEIELRGRGSSSSTVEGMGYNTT